MFWWHLVNFNKKELLYKFYTAQKLKPNKGDWVEQLGKDKRELGLQLKDEEIIRLSKAKFRGIVKTKIEKIAAKYLNEIKYNHSKNQNLKFEGFKPARQEKTY